MTEPSGPAFLRQQFSAATVRRVQRELRWGRFFARHPLLVRVLRSAAYRLGTPALLAADARTEARSLPLANVVPVADEVIGYDGDKEELTFFKYRAQLRDIRAGMATRGESRRLYEEIIAVMSRLLEGTPAIGRFLNFGVGYAYVDHVLAERFPRVEFHGIDRSPFTKALNEVEFGGLTNLQFFDGDLRDHLKQTSYGGGVFFHARTALLIPRPILEDIYRSAFQAGFRYVVGFEQVGLSRETFAPYEFDDRDKDSVLFRRYMFIHNYPAVLRRAGFAVTRFEAFATDHVHDDFRMLSFTAERVG